MRNIKITLEYQGTDFCGWQRQPEGRTVQGVLEESLRSLLQEAVKTIGAGRTDAGVHALGQVANFNTKSDLRLKEIHRGLNALLPPDVVVRHVRKVPEGFHARYHATSRRYLYRLVFRPTAVQRHFTWTVQGPLDLVLMRKSTLSLLGIHDFSGFCLGPEERSHCRCTVLSASLKRVREEAHFQIRANRFLHSMVRIIVGRLVEVGRGRLSLDKFLDYLEGGKDQRSISVAPAQGLCLLGVTYDGVTGRP
jgi:tRNA pseudouridine38-40 synthase